MKWVVRVLAGVIIALLIVAAIRGFVLFKIAGLGSAAVVFFVGRYEGLDMSRFWGDDDDDEGQGPLRPA